MFWEICSLRFSFLHNSLLEFIEKGIFQGFDPKKGYSFEILWFSSEINCLLWAAENAEEQLLLLFGQISSSQFCKALLCFNIACARLQTSFAELNMIWMFELKRQTRKQKFKFFKPSIEKTSNQPLNCGNRVLYVPSTFSTSLSWKNALRWRRLLLCT